MQRRDFLLFNGEDPQLSRAVQNINNKVTLHEFGTLNKNINTTYIENDKIHFLYEEVKQENIH